MEWYYIDENGEPRGPCSIDQIKAANQNRSNYYVYTTSFADWRLVSTVLKFHEPHPVLPKDAAPKHEAKSSEPQESRPGYRDLIPGIQLSFLNAATLKQLQEAGLVEDDLPQELVENFAGMQKVAGYNSVWGLLAEQMPNLLTETGEQVEDERSRREVERMDEYAQDLVLENVPEREPDDLAATAKQIQFLRSLGVRDETLLASLGKWQASTTIDRVLEDRREGPCADA